MRYNSRGFQRQAHEVAALREPVYGSQFRQLRLENERRAAAAAARLTRSAGN